MSTQQAEDPFSSMDEHTHNDGADLRKRKTFAQEIDASIMLHSIYGLLDGLSVSYSTVKFLCDVLSKNNKEYKDNLNFVLSDLEFWLPMVMLGSFFITTLSYYGNSGPKQDKKDLGDVQKLSMKAWIYARDILKGSKNGYKGIKNLTSLLTSLQFLDSKNARMIFLPVGLAFAIVGMINRVYFRYLDRCRKDLNKRSAEILKELEAYSTLHANLAQASVELRGLLAKKKAGNSDDIYVVNHDIAQKRAQIQSLKSDIAVIEGSDLLARQAALAKEQAEYQARNNVGLMISKVIGAIVDAPYLYIGALTLATLSTPALTTLSYFMAAFLVGCVIARSFEEYEAQKKLKVSEAKLNLQALISQFNRTQKQVAELDLDNLEQYSAKFKGHAEMFELASWQHSKGELKPHFDNLKRTHDQIVEQVESIRQLLKPTQTSAVLHGLTDGLVAYGALSSIYFALSIALALAGHSFPPFLIMAGVGFGVVAMLACIGLRLYKAQDDMINFQKSYSDWKDRLDRRMVNDAEATLLSPLDCNTDGFLKGEFWFQQISEAVRCLFSGPYKGQNLADMFFAPLEGMEKDKSVLAGVKQLFWGGLTLIYSASLTLRAWGRGFGRDVKKAQPQLETASSSFVKTGHSFFSPSAAPAKLKLGQSETAPSVDDLASMDDDKALAF